MQKYETLVEGLTTVHERERLAQLTATADGTDSE